MTESRLENADENNINPFQANVPFLYPLKTSDVKFSGDKFTQS